MLSKKNLFQKAFHSIDKVNCFFFIYFFLTLRIIKCKLEFYTATAAPNCLKVRIYFTSAKLHFSQVKGCVISFAPRTCRVKINLHNLYFGLINYQDKDTIQDSGLFIFCFMEINYISSDIFIIYNVF